MLTGTLLGWLLSATARLALRATRRVPRDAPMPLDPYLVAGTLATVILTSVG